MVSDVHPSARVRARRRRPTLAFVVVCACVVGNAPPRVENARAASDGETQSSSILAFVDAVASALEGRASAENATGPLDLEVRVGRGMDPALVERAFTSRLRQRLRERGLLPPSTKAALRARVVVSVEGARLWAAGQLEGGKLPGPSSFAVSRALDRELEVLVGKAKEPVRARWTLERLGPVTAGVLDVVLADIDGDFVDDIVVLHVDDVRAYRFAPGDMRPSAIGKRVALAPLRWPRTVVGWVADRGQGRVWIATSRGDLTVVDLIAGTASEVPMRGVPLRQVVSPVSSSSSSENAAFLVATGAVGTPLLTFPLREADGTTVGVDGMPQFRFRDFARVAGKKDTWLWIDADGFIGARAPGKAPVRLAPGEPVGDRFAVTDLDGDGELEIVTSAATSPREADLLSILRVDRALTTTEVIFRSPLSGGEIVALAIGDLDLDARPDIILVEESGDSEAMVWRVEHAP
jgi:hypothetical protein